MKNYFLAFVLPLFVLAACSSEPGKVTKETVATSAKADSVAVTEAPKKAADLATILAKKEVPVLCYHHIRNVPAGQSENMKSYSVSPASFAEQMKARQRLSNNFTWSVIRIPGS